MPWGTWLQQNFDKLLLLCAWVIGLTVVLHLMHHSADQANISWGRESAGTLLGAFLGLITGARYASSKGTAKNEPADGGGSTPQ